MELIDMRHVLATFLTFYLFIMLGNMIKRAHIDPLLEAVPTTSHVQGTRPPKQGMVKLIENSYASWKEEDEVGRPCWKIPPQIKESRPVDGYIFFSLTNGPEYHSSQLANALVVARHTGATLVLPDIREAKPGEPRHFEEFYDVDHFMTSLGSVVRVVRAVTAAVQRQKMTVVKVPNRVSAEFISSKVTTAFARNKNVRIITYFEPLSSAKTNDDNAYHCLAMFHSLKLQPELQDLVESMVGTLQSLSQKAHGRFIAVDLRAEVLMGRRCRETARGKRCNNASSITQFLRKIGFQNETTIYLTQDGWEHSLNALRDVFPNTFTKDVIVPADEKGKFMDFERKFIDFHICSESDVFIPAFRSRFYAGVVGKRIASGKEQVLIPENRESVSANDYLSPYVAKKSHFAYTCFCKG